MGAGAGHLEVGEGDGGRAAQRVHLFLAPPDGHPRTSERQGAL